MPETEARTTGANADSSKRTRKRIWWRVPAALVLLLLAIQLIPYGRRHTNPPVTVPVAWDSPETESLVRGACFDCHSNETRWPWYSRIAPASWLVQSDVDEARAKLDFSEGRLGRVEGVPDVVSNNEMPPWFYRLAHRDARLSAEGKQALIRGVRATFEQAARTDSHRSDSD